MFGHFLVKKKKKNEYKFIYANLLETCSLSKTVRRDFITSPWEPV